MITENDLVFKAAEGVALGAGVDQLLYAAGAYIPQITESSGIQIPGYAEAGIHYDDLLALAVSAAVVVDGVINKKNEDVVKGVAMMAGSFISSQFQRELPKQIGQTINQTIRTGDTLVRID